MLMTARSFVRLQNVHPLMCKQKLAAGTVTAVVLPQANHVTTCISDTPAID